MKKIKKQQEVRGYKYSLINRKLKVRQKRKININLLNLYKIK